MPWGKSNYYTLNDLWKFDFMLIHSWFQTPIGYGNLIFPLGCVMLGSVASTILAMAEKFYQYFNKQKLWNLQKNFVHGICSYSFWNYTTSITYKSFIANSWGSISIIIISINLKCVGKKWNGPFSEGVCR